MDHYADDLAALTEHLDLKDAVHVGHSTGGGEVVALSRPARRKPRGEGRAHQRRAAAYGEDRRNPGGLPKEVFDGFQKQLAATERSSTATSPRGRSTASTVPARNHPSR